MNGWQFRFLTWFSCCLAAGSWPLFLTTPRLDWALVVIPLVLTASAAVQLTGYRRVYRAPVDVSGPRPDYAAIARMEREVYGETFRHDGAAAAGFGPVAAARRQTQAQMFEDDRRAMRELAARSKTQCRAGHPYVGEPPQTCPECDEQRWQRHLARREPPF